MDLDIEKSKALEEVKSISEKEKELVENANKKISLISKAKTIKLDGIVTRKRTKKSYSNIWKIFLSIEPEFKAYMGYGKEEIEAIGINKFIDFMDWSEEEDILKYKSDRVKAIPCIHCGKNMTTFQLDMGLCEHCKPLYYVDKLTKIMAEEDKINPGASFGVITAFIYVKEFRDMYYKNANVSDMILDAYMLDTISGAYTRDLLIDRVIGNPLYEENFFKIGEGVLEKMDTDAPVKERMEDIKGILLSGDSLDKKKEKVSSLFK